MRIFHVCVNIAGALKQKSLWFLEDDDGKIMSTHSAKKFLLNQQAKGKKYFTGCNNETEEGRCGGHES